MSKKPQHQLPNRAVYTFEEDQPKKRGKGVLIALICLILAAVIAVLVVFGVRHSQTKKEPEKKQPTTSAQQKTKTAVPVSANPFPDLKAGYNMPYAVTVNTAKQIVTVYQKDPQSGKYTVPVKAFTCSTGLHRGDTPEKTYYMPADSRQPMWYPLDGGVYGEYATRISPHSEHILFHSVPYTKAGDPSSLQRGEYNKLGSPASHGCVRMRSADIKWIYDHLDPGTCVRIYYGPNVQEPVQPKAAQKVTNDTASKYYGWDPTDADPRNPY
ncbi:MAG: L,D-transpeptidase [Acutalibacteraceae bacterium]|nr:L,D-transpeptidase [Acutalibacteraceae bacterium]